MTHGSLFSGIGGFDLAAEWMGWENLFHCEINKFGRLVLKYYWPYAKSYEDIKTTDFTIWRGLIDVLSGGFPCQPYSTAGKRKGKDDDRHLWPEMLRAIREIQPSYVVGENVRGLTNWNGGMVFDEVQADLEAEGYEVLPFLLPACGVNAPHRRDRIWFIAYSHGNGHRRHSGLGKTGCKESESIKERDKREWVRDDTRGNDAEESSANTNSNQRREGGLYEEGREKATGYISACNTRHVRGNWEDFPTQFPVRGRNDGVPNTLAGITFSKWSEESLKAMGNAIVPQAVYQIYKTIETINSL